MGRRRTKARRNKNERLLDMLNRASVFVLVLSLLAVYCAVALRTTGTLMPTMELIDGHAAVRFIDVGQGDCTLVTYRGHGVLIDTGPSFFAERTAEVVRTYAPKLDAVFVTHPHGDHMGGCADVLASCRVKTLYLSPEDSTEVFFADALAQADRRGTGIVRLTGGGTFRFGEIAVEVYDTSSCPVGDEDNDKSLAIRVTVDGLRVLVCGDAETTEERYLAEQGYDLAAEILQVNHHGSDSSSSEEFLRRVSPRVAVISVGRGNSYGHPSMKVLERLESLGIGIRRTDREGTVVIRGGEDFR